MTCVCVCGHLAELHRGLVLASCSTRGCGCVEYVRDWRVRGDAPKPPATEQLPLS